MVTNYGPAIPIMARIMNIRTLSKLSGISVCTLSRVLSGRAREFRISRATEDKVLKLAVQYGYRPNYLARSLNTGATHTIGVVLANYVDRFLGLILEGIEAELRSSEYVISVVTCENSKKLQHEALQTLAHRKVDGIILYPRARGLNEAYSLPDELTADSEGPPLLVVGRDAGISCDKIFFADYEAGTAAAQRLLEHDCQRFAFVTNPSTCSSDRARGEGFVAALLAAGIKRKQIARVCYGQQSWNKKILQPFRTGLFGVNTGLLVTYLEELQRRRTLENLHMTSVGALESQALLSLPWDTLITPNRLMGAQAARTLLRRIKNPKRPNTEKTLPLNWLG